MGSLGICGKFESGDTLEFQRVRIEFHFYHVVEILPEITVSPKTMTLPQ